MTRMITNEGAFQEKSRGPLPGTFGVTSGVFCLVAWAG